MFDKGNVQDTVTLSDGHQAVVDVLAVPAKALMDTPQIADGIEKGVSMFMEAVPVIMKTLDGLADIHPFIAGMGEPVPSVRVLIGDVLVAVAAFKAVYTLEVTRRSNDQKIIAIYAEYVARLIFTNFISFINPQDERYDGRSHPVRPPMNCALFARLKCP